MDIVIQEAVIKKIKSWEWTRTTQDIANITTYAECKIECEDGFTLMKWVTLWDVNNYLNNWTDEDVLKRLSELLD